MLNYDNDNKCRKCTAIFQISSELHDDVLRNGKLAKNHIEIACANLMQLNDQTRNWLHFSGTLVLLP